MSTADAEKDEILNKDEDLDFDFGAKKKKKKKGAAEESASKTEEQPAVASQPQAGASESNDVDELNAEMFGDMKKKKKKKAVEEVEKPKEEKEDDIMDEFDDMKKKKKKTLNMNDFEKELNELEDDGVDIEMGDEDSTVVSAGVEDDSDVKFGNDASASAEDPWLGTDRDYTYKELLDRAFRIIKQANPDAEGGRKRYTMIPPQVVREGTKKTLFANIAEISKRMHRQPDHVIAYLFSELGTTGSVDGGQRLIIKGRFQPPQIETVLRGYILEYVTCKICKNPDTVLTKENRLTFMQCQACGAKRSVSNIKSGFSAAVDKKKAN